MKKEVDFLMPESYWRHRNGIIYKLLFITNRDTLLPDKYPVTVVYQGVANGKLWSKPLGDWCRSMTYIGETNDNQANI